MPINTLPVTPSDALNIMIALSSIPNPPSVMLHGAPGIGKSQIVQQLVNLRAEQQGKKVARTASELTDGHLLFSDMRLTTMESQDLRGLPYPNKVDNTVIYLRPSFLPPMDDGFHVVFADEITAAEQRLQATAYQLLLDRRVGDHALGPNVFVVAAGNGAEHGAISNEMGTAIADRLIHLNVVSSPDAWIKWGKDADVAAEVLTFIQTRPDFLDMCEKRVKENLTIAGSPRGWERVSNVIKGYRKNGSSQAVLEHTVPGIVGQEAAAEFFLVLSELSEAVNVQKLMEMSDAERRRNLPRTLTSAYGLVYSLLPAIKDKDSMEIVFQILLAMKETRMTEVPNAEIATLGFEMAFGQCEKMKLFADAARSPTYHKYNALRKAEGLA